MEGKILKLDLGFLEIKFLDSDENSFKFAIHKLGITNSLIKSRFVKLLNLEKEVRGILIDINFFTI